MQNSSPTSIRGLNSRKGISALISIVIVIAFVVALTAVIANYFSSYTNRQTSAIGNKSEQMIKCSYANLELDSQVYDQAENQLKVSLMNQGREPFREVNVIAIKDGRVLDKKTTDLGKSEAKSVVFNNLNSKPDKVEAISVQCPGSCSRESTSLSNQYKGVYSINTKSGSFTTFSIRDNSTVQNSQIWVYSNNNSYLYSKENNLKGELAVGNNSGSVAWENESSLQGNNPEQVWNNSGEVGVWHFGQGSGSTANDSTSNHNHGQLTNMIPYESSHALEFDGVDDDVNLGSAVGALTDGGSDVRTVTAWFKSSDSGQNTIFCRYNEYWSYLSNGGLMIKSFGDNSGTLGSGYADGSWHHAAFIYAEGNEYRIYADGSELFGSPVSTSDIGSAGSYDALISESEEGAHFNGKIDDVRIYDRALSGNEIKKLYRGEDVTDNLVSHWSFDKGEGTTAIDSAGNNNGTLQNGPTWVSNVKSGWTDGKFGKALEFDGKDDYVDLGNGTTFSGHNEITLYSWLEVVPSRWTVKTKISETSTSSSTVSFSPSAKILVFADDGGSVRIFNTTNWNEIQTLTPNSGEITSISFSPSGDLFAYGTNDYQAYIYNTTNWNHLQTINSSVPVMEVSLSESLLAYGGADHRIYFNDTSDWSQMGNCGEAGYFMDYASLNPSGNLLAYSDYQSEVEIHNTSNCYGVQGFDQASSGVGSLSFSPSGNLIAYGGAEGNLYIHNTSDWSLIQTLNQTSVRIQSVSFSFSEDIIAYGDENGKVYIHNTSDWNHLQTISWSSAEVNSISFSPSGSLLAYGSLDGNVYIYTKKKTIVGKGEAYNLGIEDSNFVGWLNGEKVSTMITDNMNNVVLSYNGQEQKLWVNSKLRDSKNISEPITTNENNLMIGNNLEGTIDEVRVYNRALSEQEIQRQYWNGIGNYSWISEQ